MIIFHPVAHDNIELAIKFTNTATDAKATPDQVGDIKVKTSKKLNGATLDVEVVFSTD